MSGVYRPICTNMDKKTTKVYINPNYKCDNRKNHNSSMYFNPNFAHSVPILNQPHKQPHVQPDSATSKIYFNPNFIHSSSTYCPSSNNCQNTIHPVNPQPKPLIVQNPIVTPISKSRYSIVRTKENQNLNTAPNHATVTNNTMKVNKYKLVSITAVKNKLAVEQTPASRQNIITTNKNLTVHNKFKKAKITSYVNQRYKLIKGNTSCIEKSNVKNQTKILNNYVSTQTKKISQIVLKKNNIPCPLFKKYGFCLRKIRGTCEFLHDKKYVSTCRNFLKGICHDKACLLSHDLTDKKMPTCYFYLQGTCTKHKCPYLHVKLNDKAKVCQEFLKGYCEKGDQCLNRHVDLGPKEQAKIKTAKKILKKDQSVKVIIKKKPSAKNNIENEGKGKESNVIGEQRYFKETVDSTEYCNLKPSRCKLGTLPSFIHL